MPERQKSLQPKETISLKSLCDSLPLLHLDCANISARVSYRAGGPSLSALSDSLNPINIDAEVVDTNPFQIIESENLTQKLSYHEKLLFVAFDIGRSTQWHRQVARAVAEIEKQITLLFSHTLPRKEYLDESIAAMRAMTYLEESLFSPTPKPTKAIIEQLNALVVNTELRLLLVDLVFFKLDLLCQILDINIDIERTILSSDMMARARRGFEYQQSLIKLMDKAKASSFQTISDTELSVFFELLLDTSGSDHITQTLLLTFLGVGDTIVSDQRILIPNPQLAEDVTRTPENKQALKAADALVAEGRNFIDLSHCVWKKIVSILSQPRHLQFGTVCDYLTGLSQNPVSSAYTDRAYQSLARTMLHHKSVGKDIDIFGVLSALERHATLSKIADYLQDPDTLPGHRLVCSPSAALDVIILTDEEVENTPQPGVHRYEQLQQAAGRKLIDHPLILAEKYFRNRNGTETTLATSNLEIERIDGALRSCHVRLIQIEEGSFVVDSEFCVESRESSERSYLHFYTRIHREGMQTTAPWNVTNEEARWVGALELQLCLLIYNLLDLHQPQSRKTQDTQTDRQGGGGHGKKKKRGNVPAHDTPPPAPDRTPKIESNKKWYPIRFVYGDRFSPENGLRKSVEEFIGKYAEARQNGSISQFDVRKMHGTKHDVYRIKWSGIANLRIMYQMSDDDSGVAVIVGAFFKRSGKDYDTWLKNLGYK